MSFLFFSQDICFSTILPIPLCFLCFEKIKVLYYRMLTLMNYFINEMSIIIKKSIYKNKS